MKYLFLSLILVVQVVLLFGLKVVYEEVQTMKNNMNTVHEYQYKQITKKDFHI